MHIFGPMAVFIITLYLLIRYIVRKYIARKEKLEDYTDCNPKEEAFRRISKSLKRNKFMVMTTDDGIYIRPADPTKDGANSLEWVNVYPLDKKRRKTSNYKQLKK